MPILRSLLIGILTIGGLLVLLVAGDVELYTDYLAGLPGLPSAYSYPVVVLICRLSWAWVALSIASSYVWHTRRLDRTTRMGTVADALMAVQYACWVVLALVLQIHLYWPFRDVIK